MNVNRFVMPLDPAYEETCYALHDRLPQGIEIAAMRFAVNALRESGHGHVADILAAYVDRWKKAAS